MNKFLFVLILGIFMLSVSGCTSSDKTSGGVSAKNPLSVDEATKLIKQDINSKKNQSNQYEGNLVPGSVKIIKATHNQTTVSYEEKFTYGNGDTTTYSVTTQFYTNENGEWILFPSPV